MDLIYDVVVVILLCLPVKSLLRFRSVSKFWCSIIDSSTFRQSHCLNYYKSCTNNQDLLFLRFAHNKEINAWRFSIISSEDGGSYSFPSFQAFLNNNMGTGDRLHVVGPANGLICVYNRPLYRKDLPSWTPIMAVCNPCTSQINILPVSPVCEYLLCHCGFESGHIGIGFDWAAQDYRIVQLTSCQEGNMYVEIYSGATNAWRRLQAADGSILLSSSYSVVAVNSTEWGWAHWRTVSKTGDDVLLSFDVENEVFGTMSIPHFEERVIFEMFARGGDSFVLYVKPFLDDVLEVWELRRGGGGELGSTTRVTDIDFRGQVPRPIALLKDGVVLEMMMSDKRNRDLIFYDCSTQEQIKCLELPPMATRWDDEILVGYKSTLNSLQIF